jgi:hypothetical protein
VLQVARHIRSQPSQNAAIGLQVRGSSCRRRPSALASCHAQCRNGMSWSEAHRELIVVSTTDDGSVVWIFPDPDDPFWVYIDFHAINIFKHHKLHGDLLGPIAEHPSEGWESHRAEDRLYRRTRYGTVTVRISGWEAEAEAEMGPKRSEHTR